MKILLVTWACDLEDVSEPEISAKWVRELSKDHEVTVFAVSRPDRYGCVSEQFPNLTVIEWSDIRVPKFLERFRAIVKPWYFIYYFKARFFLKKIIKEKNIDIIHHLTPLAWRYPSPVFNLGIPSVRGPVQGGLKTPPGLSQGKKVRFHPFMFLRKTDNLRLHYDPILRNSYKKIDHLLVSAPYVIEFLKPLNIKHVSVEIEHGISETPDRQEKIESDCIRLLFVGRVVESKGLIFAIHALSQVKTNHKIVYTVIGDGDDLERCKNESISLGVNNIIDFIGWQDKKTVQDYYKKSDIFLFPSYREPTGGVLLEAMSNGLPCITCQYGGTDYFVSDECGIKIFPDEEDKYIAGLKNAIESLVNDETLRINMSNSAYERALNVFHWEAKRKRLKELYIELKNKTN